MRIAIDMDDVLVSHVPSLCSYHNKAYGTSFSKSDFHSYKFWEVWGGTKDEAIDKVDAFFKSEMGYLKPVEGSVSAVKELSKNHKLYIVSSRKFDVKSKSIEWLNLHFGAGFFEGVKFCNHFHKTKKGVSKAEVCEKIGADYLIDDQLAYAEECSEKGIKVLLLDLDYPWNKADALPSNVFRVSSWREISDFFRKEE